MTVQAISIDAVVELGWTYEPIAVRIVGFDCYGRGFSDIRFTADSVIAEYKRLTRLGYNIGLVDHGDNWRRTGSCLPVAELAAKLAYDRATPLYRRA